MTSALGVLGTRTAELDLSLCTQREGAIYLLIANGDVVYVGQTQRLVARIGLHISGDKRTSVKSFDTVRWFPCEIDDLDAYEGALIRFLRPRYNRRAPYRKGSDNDVLAALGLPLHADEEANEREWRASIYTPRGQMRAESLTIPRKQRAHRERAKQHARAQRLFAGIELALIAQGVAA